MISALTVHFIRRDGLRFRVIDEGQRHQPALVFLHAITTRSEVWQAQARLLRQHYRVVRMDYRGHGLSTAPDHGYAFADLAADVAAVTRKLGLRRFVLIGLSFGGMIAQAFATRYPERLTGLVLCGAACEWTEAERAMWQARLATLAEQGIEALAQPALDRWLSPAYQRNHPMATETVRRYVIDTGTRVFLRCGEAILDLNLTQALRRLRLPSLVLVGEHDPGTPPRKSRQIARSLAGSRLVVVRDAWHFPQMERPAAVNAELRRFLAGIRAAA